MPACQAGSYFLIVVHTRKPCKNRADATLFTIISVNTQRNKQKKNKILEVNLKTKLRLLIA